MKERTINIGLHTISWIFFLMLPVLLHSRLLELFEYDTCFIFHEYEKNGQEITHQ